ncbi:MAG: RNase adapter RapZ [Lachnospiraceae bacterium]|nr:RNase adapter RapZ [Lachnospiraceae bacterium]MCR5769415.1 RNase adapter RapZ [Lachnospiraceae bacterium]
MEVMIITGLSGSGKSKALKVFEDNGYYCLDNLPTKLLADIVRMLEQIEDFPNKACIAIDTRDANITRDANDSLDELKKVADIRILFLECDQVELVRRYKETRRLHPLMMYNASLDLISAIGLERELLSDIRARADYIIDTSLLSSSQFREKLLDTIPAGEEKPMSISFVAFGYKYGLGSDFDLVFDVRCLPNPFYVEALRGLTGKDEAVREYVMSSPDSQALFKRITDYLDTAIPLYEKEGKAQLVVGFGCTGGQHRSLTFAIKLAESYAAKGYLTKAVARDTDKNIHEISTRV